MTDFNTAMEQSIEFRRTKPLRGAGSAPAVIVVDFQRAFTETPRCGPATIDALSSTAELVTSLKQAIGFFQDRSVEAVGR